MSDNDSLPIKRAAGILLLTPAPVHFLLMRHSKRWDLPKGHAEPGESLTETALRETEEETGLSASLIQLDPSFRFELQYRVEYKRDGGGVFEKQVVYFLGHVDQQFTPTLTEHQGFEWFPWSPPHQIQTQTIDPLLLAVESHLAQSHSDSDA